MMQIHFRGAENQLRWAWTDGLRTLGQREIAVMVPWPEHDSRDRLITHLLRFLENYLISQPKRILPEQTLRYGWTTLRFVVMSTISVEQAPMFCSLRKCNTLFPRMIPHMGLE